MDPNLGREIKKRINNKVESLLRQTNGNEFVPWVCTICDHFVKRDDVCWIGEKVLKKSAKRLSPKTWNAVGNDELEKQYKYPSNAPGYKKFMSTMMLSPRGSLYEDHDKRYTSCKACQTALKYNQMPQHAIANNNFTGATPKELLDLNPVELAFITPTKTHGYCFTWKGGRSTNLSGSLGYYKVDNTKIAQGVGQLWALGAKVVILIHGKMTAQQKAKAKENSTLRVDKIVAALKWLSKNHSEGEGFDPEKWKERYEKDKPVVIDKSKEEDGSEDPDESNVEVTEKFCVYYPDGTANEFTGGQATQKDFRDIVQNAKENGYDLEWQCNLERELVSDVAKENIFTLANLLQFPYGRGGFNECRETKNGEYSERTDPNEFVAHLSMMSLPQFHRPLHTLMLYNMTFKSLMLRQASCVIENGKAATDIIHGLKADDVARAGRAQAQQGHGGSAVSRKFLKYVRTVAGSLPHSNEASGKGLMAMEAICHNKGPPQAFLTVTYDDDNSFLVQAYADCKIDDEQNVGSLSDDELRKRAQLRTELRLRYPGIAALAFEEVLNIVMKEVVGWDCDSNKATDEDGLFGRCYACTYAVEEQGRKTLHVHILIWTHKLRDLFKKLNSEGRKSRAATRKQIANFFDSIATTELIKSTTNDKPQKQKLKQATMHNCTERVSRKRKLPEVVSEQELRNLRHMDGYAACNGAFVKCPHCTEGGTFTNEQLIERFLIKGEQIEGLTAYPEPGTRRLKAMFLQHQKPTTTEELNPVVIRAAYNNHLSSHTDTCFRCRKTNKKRKTGEHTKHNCGTKGYLPTDVECRARMPALPQPRGTTIEETEERDVFRFDGSVEQKPFFVLRPKRNTYDCFQNVSCFPISDSKLGTGNTNVNLLFPGPFLPYTCKYQMKKTQTDDQAEFKNVVSDMRKLLDAGRKHESDRSEVMRMVIRSTFKHNSSNVVGAPMAAFLTRSKNRSRFYLSHESVWLPLRDMKNTLLGKEPSARIKYRGTMKIVEFQCRHYLCRPRELEDMNFFDFTKNYEVDFVPVTKKNDAGREVQPFINTSQFEHPSYIRERMRQGVKERSRDMLIKVFQGMFPDAAQFGGDILDSTTESNDKTEEYAFLVLMMFMPFRGIEDFSDNGAVDYTTRLRMVHNQRTVIDEEHYDFLQNIQDVKHNYLRYGRIPDALEANTDLYKPDRDMEGFRGEDESDTEEDLFAAEASAMMDELLEKAQSGETDDRANPYPESISFNALKSRGTKKHVEDEVCDLGDRGDPTDDVLENFVRIPTPIGDPIVPDGTNSDAPNTEQQRIPSQLDIMKLFAIKRRVRIPVPTKEKEMNALEPNGTVESIIDWCKKAKLDKRQRRAFSVLVAQFVLTYYEDADRLDDISRRGRSDYRRERSRLRRLVCTRRTSERISKKTIMFLHGAGGSGKSTVLTLVLQYCQGYCEHLDVPFTKNTIMVTAMSGVAATLLHGRTTHSTCCLSRKPTTNDFNAWKETRMLIIDEILFASEDDIVTLDMKLRLLKDNMERKYGGIHIVFSGDFRQLDPVKKDPIHEQHCERFVDWVNCFIELDGMHRFKDNKFWGRILMRFRDGTVTVDDIREINERCLDNLKDKNNGKPVDIPKGIQYASFDNKTRDRINTSIFENYVKNTYEETGQAPKDAVLVFMDELYRKDAAKKWVPIRSKQTFWEHCGEDDIKTGRQKPRLDSVLKLFYKCPVMLTHNVDVESAQANGTCAVVDEVLLKAGEAPFSVALDCGAEVKGVLASQVDTIRLRHCDPSLSPPEFDLKPETYTFGTKWPIPEELRVSQERGTEWIRMQGHQIPCVVNHATTGHKLQGKSVDNILVANWNYRGNWVYVVLSRVRTMGGLFLQKPLDLDVRKYAPPASFFNMIKHISDRCAADYFSDNDYDCILNDEPFP